MSGAGTSGPTVLAAALTLGLLVVLFVSLAMCKAAGCLRYGGAADVFDKRLVLNVVGSEGSVAPPAPGPLDSVITVTAPGGGFVLYAGDGAV